MPSGATCSHPLRAPLSPLVLERLRVRPLVLENLSVRRCTRRFAEPLA